MKATNIKWDVDYNEDNDMLPVDVEIPQTLIDSANEDGKVDIDVLCESVGDWLSDSYGFCHDGFDIEK